MGVLPFYISLFAHTSLVGIKLLFHPFLRWAVWVVAPVVTPVGRSDSKQDRITRCYTTTIKSQNFVPKLIGCTEEQNMGHRFEECRSEAPLYGVLIIVQGGPLQCLLPVLSPLTSWSTCHKDTGSCLVAWEQKQSRAEVVPHGRKGHHRGKVRRWSMREGHVSQGSLIVCRKHLMVPHRIVSSFVERNFHVFLPMLH